MTREEQREEQIKYEALKRYPIQHPFLDISKESFIEGAKWADENPKEGLVSIDKVCKYLDNVLYEVVSGISSLPDVMSIENTTMEDFIKNFRKAMEE